MQKIVSLGLIIILTLIIYTGCKKNKGDPPVLPPQESMSIDFTDFDAGKKSEVGVSLQKGTENSNWDFAAEAATVWKMIINSTLIIPVTSYKLATNEVPVFVSENTWQWSYDFELAGVKYKARLTGQIGSADVIWKMYITKEGTGGFTDFIWFNGTSKVDGTGGKWVLFQSPQVSVAILQIDWTSSGASVATIKYTFIKNGDPFNTSYIESGFTTASLNAYYTIHYYNSNILKFSDVNVEWNTSTLNGRVKCLDYLGDTDWHCWDANKINVKCQ
jgi:hypothetical protein